MIVPPVLREHIILAVALAEDNDHAGNLSGPGFVRSFGLVSSAPLGSPVAWHTLAGTGYKN